MNEKDFEKGIKDFKNIRMADAEKEHMLNAVLSTPIPSPYMKRYPMFTFIYSSRYGKLALVLCLIFAISFSGAVSISGDSLPGDLLYPIKVMMVEPILDVINHAPEQKILWEEEKVTRRLVEAEKLAEKHELSDERVQSLENDIKKDSRRFIEAVNASASSNVASSTPSANREEVLKQAFRKKIIERKEISEQKESETINHKVERLKNAAIQVVDDENRHED
jgi:hypothetical protein